MAGSGVTGDLLAHSIDSAMWLNGPISRVVRRERKRLSSNASTRSPASLQDVGIDDACMFLAEFANGSMGTFESTRYGPAAARTSNTLELNGADGSVYFDLEDPEYLHFFEYTRGKRRRRRWKAT